MPVQLESKTAVFHCVGAAGHLHSSLAIADRLKRDFSYKCVFIIVGKPPGNSIEDHGHELIVVEEENPFEEETSKKKLEGFDHVAQVMMKNVATYAESPIESLEFISKSLRDHFERYVVNYKKVSDEIDRLNPDVVLVDSRGVPPGIIKQAARRPWVRVISSSPLIVAKSKLPFELAPYLGLSFLTKAERQVVRSNEPEKWSQKLIDWQKASELVKCKLEASSLPLRQLLRNEAVDETVALNTWTHMNSTHLNVYMYPYALNYNQDDDLFAFGPRFVNCDSLLREPLGKQDAEEELRWLEKLEARKADRKQVVLLSLGSLVSCDDVLMRKLIEILSHDTKRLYVVSKGANGHRFELNSENMIGDNFIPQTLVLQHSDLAIVHGGNNGLTECMYYGVPMIVMPFFTDQFDNAQRVEDLRFGRRLNAYTCTQNELATAIDELLSDESLKQRLQTISRQMRARDEVGKVSVLIDKLASKRHLDEEECHL